MATKQSTAHYPWLYLAVIVGSIVVVLIAVRYAQTLRVYNDSLGSQNVLRPKADDITTLENELSKLAVDPVSDELGDLTSETQ